MDTGKPQPISSLLDTKTSSKLPRRQSTSPKGPLYPEINASCDLINHESWGLSLKVFPEEFWTQGCNYYFNGPPLLHSVFVLHFLSSFYFSSLLHPCCQLCWYKIGHLPSMLANLSMLTNPPQVPVLSDFYEICLRKQTCICQPKGYSEAAAEREEEQLWREPRGAVLARRPPCRRNADLQQANLRPRSRLDRDQDAPGFQSRSFQLSQTVPDSLLSKLAVCFHGHLCFRLIAELTQH